jgi:predicted nucleotidyltransferase
MKPISKSLITKTFSKSSGIDKPLWPALEDFPVVESVCLFGSAAREEERGDSDIDVLVVLSDSEDLLGLRREAKAIRAAVDEKTQICLLAERRLRENFEERTVFAAHLAREGRIVADRKGALTRLFEDFPEDQPVRESAQRLKAQLEVYSDLSWCGGHYLFCLADLYAWSRSGAMLVLARKGVFEFNRDRVFDRLSMDFPDLKEAAMVAKRLRPFWEKVNRTGSPNLPFPDTGSDREVLAAREACVAILDKGL